MSEKRRYMRFPLPDRIEHWLLVASFSTLAVTGLVQKYALVSLSQWFINLLGGIEAVRTIHHIAAVVLMFESVYHIGQLGYKIFVRRTRLSMLPTFSDIRAAWHAFTYNLGIRKVKPQQGRYSFEEKLEYWAVIWGTLVMGITGFLMWNPIASTRFLPGQLIPAAKAAHSGEALLAVLAIIVWHLYNVHLRHFNKSMFTGHLTEEEMLEEHPLELADLKAGLGKLQVDSKTLTRRKRVFFPIFAIVASIMLAGIYAFVAFEETAVTTLPPAEQVVVFAPLTPTPLPTPMPTSPPSASLPTAWLDGFDDLFQEKCGMCHSGPAGLNGLDVSTYPSTIAGGDSGPGIVPGDPDASLLFVRQLTGDHPGQLSEEELTYLLQWIEAGAPEE